GVIHRALDANEVAVAGQWCAAAYDDKWDREFLEGREVMPNALGGVSYLISGSSAPQKLNQYNDLRPLFLASFQQILYPASMTKVLTTMVMLDNIADMGAEIEMIEGDQTSGSGNNIAPGDILTISDAIYNMMLPSSNVTTSVVARVVGGMLLNGEGGDARARFVEAMNAKARQLGMLSSSFTNPSGLSDAAMVTTPEDMARLCANVPNYPEMFNRWGVTEHELNILGPNARTQIIGHSAGQILNARDDFQGGKTGTVFSSPLGSYSANFMWIGRAPNGNYTANVVMLVTDEDRYADASGLQSFVFDSLRWPLSFAVS
ncbi:D-alanyl-D-alanine carboxypeptidase family protein, partial [Halomonas sp. AOP43-D1-39]|uniref:D-alanyl-D-alanine carboxypeptidase family protein n=1 Tax=unclassified Halomonas TaxID=2609666 RepID=UPI004033A880